MGRFDQRISSVELRPINLLTSDQIEAAVTIAPPGVSPSTIVTGSAPNQFRKVQDAYLYPKKLTGLSEDRVEVYLESDLGLDVGETIQVSGIHGSSTEDIDVDGNFEVKVTDTPPWTERASYAHDPEDDQLGGVTISNTYSFKPDTVAPTTLSARRRLQTKRLVDTYAIDGTTVTLTMNAAHKFKAGDVVFVDIFAEDSRAYGVDGLFEIDSVTSTTIVYTLSAGVDTPVTATEPAADVYVFPVARNYVPVGSTWANSSNNKIFYWDGIRWIDYSVVDAVADGDPPAAPTNLSVSSDIKFFQTATPVVEVTVGWTAPTTNESGSQLTDLLGYAIKYRSSPSNPWKVLDIPFTAGTSYVFDAAADFQPNTLYYFEVYAYDSGNLYSEALTGTHTTASAPSTNIATIRPTPIAADVYLGTITLTWDGDVEDATNTPQTKPDGLVYLDLHVSTSNGFTPSSATLLASISAVAGNKYVYADVTYGNSYYFRGVLRDASGTSSAASRQTTAQAQSLVDVSAIQGIIEAANITPGTIVTGEDIIGINITGDLIRGNEINANIIKANSITADQINAGSIGAALVQADSIRTAASGARVALNSSGIYGYNSSNGVTFRVLASTGAVFIADGVQIGGYATDGELGTVSTTATTANNTANSANSTAVTANNVAQGIYSNIYFPGTTQIDGDVIRTGTIEANRIVAGSITSTQISSSYIYAGTINANNITSGVVTGSSIQTASSGKRILLSRTSNSAVFYDDNGTLVGRVEGVTTGGGSLDLSGRGTASINIGLASTVFNGNISTAGTAGIFAAGRLGQFQWVSTGTRLGGVSYNSVGNLIPDSSDARIKTNVTSISSALEKVNRLNPVLFNWKTDENNPAKVPGLIAQEISEIFPEEELQVVRRLPDPEAEGDFIDDPMRAVDYEAFVPYLIKSIQELSQKNDELQARIATLEGTT